MGFFDGNDVDEGVLDSFENLPDGDYPVTVDEVSDVQSQNNSRCRFFKVVFEVAEGEGAGRKVFANWVHEHDSEKARNIGRARMKQLCLTLAGKAAINSPDELYGKICTIRLKTRVDKRTGEPNQNVVAIGPKSGIPKRGEKPASATRAPQVNLDAPTKTMDELGF
jgi:hypothetical protein